MVLDNDGLAAQYVANVGVGGGLVEVGLDPGLVVGKVLVDAGLVEVLDPALLFVDGGALLGLVEQGLGVKRDLSLEVEAGFVLVLLEAGVERHPGVALPMFGAPARDVVCPGIPRCYSTMLIYNTHFRR